MAKAGKEHMDRVAQLACIVCRNENLGDTPAEIHHAGTYSGGGRDDMQVLPLCPIHHRIGDGKPKFQGHISIGFNAAEFERRYGTEQELLAQVRRALGIYG